MKLLDWITKRRAGSEPKPLSSEHDAGPWIGPEPGDYPPKTTPEYIAEAGKPSEEDWEREERLYREKNRDERS